MIIRVEEVIVGENGTLVPVIRGRGRDSPHNCSAASSIHYFTSRRTRFDLGPRLRNVCTTGISRLLPLINVHPGLRNLSLFTDIKRAMLRIESAISRTLAAELSVSTG